MEFLDIVTILHVKRNTIHSRISFSYKNILLVLLKMLLIRVANISPKISTNTIMIILSYFVVK